MAEKTATWSLNLESNAPAVSKDTAKSLEGLRQQIQGSTEFIKLMSGSLRSLRGASDDVKAAKEQLKAKIDAEKGAVSKATVELLKQGTTYGKLTESAKKTTSATKDLGAGLKEAGGPLADFSGKLGAMKDFLGEGSVLLKGSALAVGVLAAAFVGVTAAIVGSTAALARWLVVSGNELRAMNLAREAAAGSAENAKALGTWVDLLSRKVSTSKDKINELAVSLTRDLSGGFSKVSGQGIVDTFAAVTQAAAAAGDEVGNAIGDIVKRSKLFGRIRINPFELQGKGINFEDVSGALSKNLKIGMKTARLALYQGMVPIDAGAKALRDAVEKRFGAINTKKLLDLNTISEKLHESWVNLTKGINLEPILGGLKEIADLFGEDQVTGAAIRDLFTDMGLALGKGVQGAVPLVKRGIKQMVIIALELELAFFRVKKSVHDWMNASRADQVKTALVGVAAVVGTIAAGFSLAAAAAGTFVGGVFLAVGYVVKGLGGLWDTLKGFYERLRGMTWSDLGSAIVGGIKSGITAATGSIAGAMTGLGDKVKQAFKDAIGWHSPPRFFLEAGKASAQAYGQGAEGGAPAAQRGADAMAPAPPTQGRASAIGGAPGGGVVVNVAIHVPPGKEGQQVAQQLSTPDFLDGLTRAIRQALVTQGIPTQAESTP